ncbi:MAG: DUF3393 domain-containing protein [Candidatus Cloacimonetes bacterium]|nr:DUF3393 domain-containing protein [Candidatus Cloacimonadota bacterium]
MKKFLIFISIIFLFTLNSASEKTKNFSWLKLNGKISSNWNEMIQTQNSLQKEQEKRINKIWNDIISSTRETWVTYSDDFHARSIVNFKEGSVKVEAVVENEDMGSKVKAKKIIKKKLEKILNEKDSKQNLIVGDQINLSLQKIKTDEISKIKIEKINNTKGKYSISLKMVPNHLQIRINKYLPLIEKYCKKFNIEPALALGIIHTESYFNPMAYNAKGDAYGLMQIVPRYAGKLMNKVLFNKNLEPTSDQLFNPEINIQIGIAYLKHLSENIWQKVDNLTNRTYCMVCSYNGGAGSVYKAMTGRMKNIKPNVYENMLSSLSTMDSKFLYKKLLNDIPFNETREYLKNVNKNYQNYKKII